MEKLIKTSDEIFYYEENSNVLENVINISTKQMDLNYLGEVKSIRSDCFKGVKGVEQIVLPIFLEKIEENAFENCQDLKSVILDVPESGLEKNIVIQSDAFKECSSLDNVYLKVSGNITIEKDAFSECFELRTVVLKGDTITIRKNAFSSSDLIIFIDKNSKSSSSVKSYCADNNITCKEIQ